MENSKFTKALKQQLTQDCSEILAYIETESLEFKNELFQVLENNNAVDSLENLILQLSRVFGICAFEQENSLEEFRERIQKSLNEYPIFSNIIEVYKKEVHLEEINEDLNGSKLFTQEERIMNYLNSFK